MNTFKFVGCSKNDVRVRLMFDKMVFDLSQKNTKNGVIRIFKLIFHTVLIFAHHCCFFNLICSTIFYPRSICSLSSKHQLRRVTHTVRAIALIFHSCDKIRGSPNCRVYKNLSTYRQVKFCVNFWYGCTMQDSGKNWSTMRSGFFICVTLWNYIFINVL